MKTQIRIITKFSDTEKKDKEKINSFLEKIGHNVISVTPTRLGDKGMITYSILYKVESYVEQIKPFNRVDLANTFIKKIGANFISTKIGASNMIFVSYYEDINNYDDDDDDIIQQKAHTNAIV
jgi:predicted CoA-binding protein